MGCVGVDHVCGVLSCRALWCGVVCRAGWLWCRVVCLLVLHLLFTASLVLTSHAWSRGGHQTHLQCGCCLAANKECHALMGCELVSPCIILCLVSPCIILCPLQVLARPDSFDVAVTTYEMVTSAEFGRPIQSTIVSVFWIFVLAQAAVTVRRATAS